MERNNRSTMAGAAAGLVILFLLAAGCTSPSPPSLPANQTVASTLPSVVPSATVTLTSAATPQQTTREIVTPGPLRTVKDPDLWFALEIPQSWDVMTRQQSVPEGYEGLVYVTDLIGTTYDPKPPYFTIITYAITRDMDQAIRATYRKGWSPTPNESTVVINGIVTDRFESRSAAVIRVAYVVRKGSANERGFASVIEYALDPAGQYRPEDLESVIATFRYLTAREVGTFNGEEIPRAGGIPLFH